jgi:hypothetical protein
MWHDILLLATLPCADLSVCVAHAAGRVHAWCVVAAVGLCAEQPGCQPAALCSTAQLLDLAQEQLVHLQQKRIADLPAAVAGPRVAA